ncbi:hypothetical protein THOM_2839 [Trachipleistophora hominis]|uniref:Zinc-ribbon 15 domain-containing protein n=1 Tax=Trachipleistophora hominis TaxID=72359 RepID=L7JU18_TRAHO|nr:hypothetical protein THOM_2839 [Trachipleistophora hominis]
MCELRFCGTKRKTKRTENQDTNDIFCPYCACSTKSVWLIDTMYFTFCFLPLYTIYNSSEYIGCKNCYKKLGDRSVKTCERCTNVIIAGYRYCGRCGQAVEP